jgi:ketosteroid isomerase-like protein
VTEADQVRSLLASWERGDFRAGVELFAEDIRFSGAQPEGQVAARGPAGIEAFMRRFLEDWERYSVELHELEELGDGRFLATGTQHGTGSTSAMDITAPVSIAIRMEDGRMTELHFFLDRDDALAVLGR